MSLALTIPAAGQSPPVLLLKASDLGIDVTRSLRTEGNVVVGQGNWANNATRLNTALVNRAYRHAFCFPGGRYDFTGTIDMPDRTGSALIGAGFARNHGESVYDDAGDGNVGGIATRLVWAGNTTAAQIDVPGWACLLDGFTLQGYPQDGAGNRAKIGIHYRAKPNDDPPNASELHLGRIGLDGQNYGILCGTNATDAPDGNGSYPSDDDLHADNLVIDHLWMRQMQTAGIWVRTDQAAETCVNFLHSVSGTYAVPIFWFERGGGFRCNHLITAGSATVLKIGRPTSNQGHFNIAGFRVDGSAAQNLTLVKFDNSYPSYRTAHAFVRIANGIIPEAENAAYLIDTGAPGAGRHCTIVLENIKGLRAGDIRLNGFQSGGSPNVYHVARLHVRNCVLHGCGASPENLLDIPNSTTLYKMTWENCTDGDQATSGVVYDNLPYADGQKTSMSLPAHP